MSATASNGAPASVSSMVTFAATLIGIGIATAIALLYAHWLEARQLEHQAQLAAVTLTACALPAEHEQMHVIVRQRGGRLVAECMHVGSRGTYARKARP